MRRFALPCIASLLLGCATQGVIVTAEGVKQPGFRPPWMKGEDPGVKAPDAPAAPAPGARPPPIQRPAAAAQISRTTVEVQCKTPAENYDFAAAVLARFGAEGQARLERLLSTDFRTSSLTPKDRQILRFMSTEMLWIPVSVEEKIGTAMLMAASDDMTPLDRKDGNKEVWDKTILMVRDLSATAPAHPFDWRLILLQKGDPGSLAGGVIYLDNDTLKSVYDDDADGAEEKLRFVIAHEMAHIYKRHRAKRIQQVLVDSDAGLKLMRQIVARGQARAGTLSVAAAQEWFGTISAIPEVAKDLMKKHERYGMDQEFEADACATAMMMGGGLGDPLRAFRGYAKDAAKLAKVRGSGASSSSSSSTGPAGSNPMMAGSMMQTHPPVPERESNIGQKMRALVTAEAPARPPAGPAPGTRSGPAAKRVGGLSP